MLTKKQLREIREHLEKAQNPIFFFDNDADGLCSFLLLQRYLGRGKGIAIRSFPEMNAEYFKRTTELNSDYVFILDKPVVSEEFLEEARKVNIPVVWIDHHKIPKLKVPEFVYYYNPTMKKAKDNAPVTYLCYQITKRKEDLWLAVIGCISDRFIPDFYSDFYEKYPDLAIKSKDAFEILYKSQIGNITRMVGSALKDSTSNVVKMLRFLTTVKTPYEALEETGKNHEMHLRFRQISQKYNKLIEKAKALADKEKVLFFQYGGDLSISADLSNELTYLFPEKIIAVAYISGAKANVSIRGKKIKKIVLKALKGLEDATGGGHEDAVGARVRVEDLEKFKEKIEKQIN
jgi:single-stranded DNA-specific DHH superfamily exonuclease